MSLLPQTFAAEGFRQRWDIIYTWTVRGELRGKIKKGLGEDRYIYDTQKLKSSLTSLCQKIYYILFFPFFLLAHKAGITCYSVSSKGSVFTQNFPASVLLSAAIAWILKSISLIIFKVTGSQDFNLFKFKRKDELGKLNLHYPRLCSSFVNIRALKVHKSCWSLSYMQGILVFYTVLIHPEIFTIFTKTMMWLLWLKRWWLLQCVNFACAFWD